MNLFFWLKYPWFDIVTTNFKTSYPQDVSRFLGEGEQQKDHRGHQIKAIIQIVVHQEVNGKFFRALRVRCQFLVVGTFIEMNDLREC